MMRSLNSGVSGVQANQVWMDVIGNNIANVNTIGFKAGRANFADAISQLLHPGQNSLTNRGVINPVQIGLGVSLQSIDNNFSQGSLETTGYATDLGIQGNGFFIVQGGDRTFYTRAGNFTLDAQGRMFAGNGIGVLQGRMANEDGVIEDTSLTDVTIPLERKITALATTEVQLYSNLDADATESVASLTDDAGSGVTSVVGTAADGFGGEHAITINGQQAQNSAADSSLAGGFTLATLLSDLNGGTVGDFTVTVDEGTDHESTITVTGLDGTSTVGDLITKLNAEVSGVEFSFDESVPGSEFIRASRSYAGDGAEYNFRLSDGVDSTIIADLFGNGDLLVNNGVASSLTAIDTFTDAATGTQITTSLSFEADPTTGLMTRLNGLGGGGVDIYANDGFAATQVGAPLLINTEATTHSTSITVYDEQGSRHNLTLTFTKTANANEWKWEAGVDDPAAIVGGQTGIVSFNSDGSLRNWSYDGGANAFSFDPGGGVGQVNITFDAGDFNGMNGITQTSSPFTTAAVGQNGYGMGTLSDISIRYDGQIIGTFTNGQERLIGQIVLADFANENGLQKTGDNTWMATEVSGDARIAMPDVELGSTIEAGQLEMSNVDLVKEFTDMIKAQRGFQASSRVITVADQILAEITNLKR